MQVDVLGGVVVVRLIAQRAHEVERLVESHLTAGRRRVVLDCTRADTLTSLQIAAIINLRRRLEHVGGVLRLAGMTEDLRAIFRILKLDRWFDLGLDVDTAVSAA
jgi:anti-anti-sigma factor